MDESPASSLTPGPAGPGSPAGAGWEDYPPDDGLPHTVAGTVRRLRGVVGPAPDVVRDLYVYLPPSAAGGGGPYPVLYLQDGQNVFDEVTSFSGEWRADEAMEALAAAGGPEAILVGVPNTGPGRLSEYAPFADPAHEGGGGAAPYLRFLTGTVKPLVDAAFPTRGEPAATGVVGSSMGGLFALFALLEAPDVFGLAGVLSPALWFGEAELFGWLEERARPGGRLNLDVGRREGRRTVANVRRLRRLLVRKGFRRGRDLRYVEAVGAGHHETAWAERLPEALAFLLG